MTTEQAMLEAAARMQSAADKMGQAAKDFDFVLSNHQRFMNDWLERLQNTLEHEMPSLGDPIAVYTVPNPNTEDKDDEHSAATLPAPADHGPLEFEGEAR